MMNSDIIFGSKGVEFFYKRNVLVMIQLVCWMMSTSIFPIFNKSKLVSHAAQLEKENADLNFCLDKSLQALTNLSKFFLLFQTGIHKLKENVFRFIKNLV